jgi:hydroxymethylglutaryl-CoA synthase
MVIVGSESGVDAAKPIAAYVHGLVGLDRRCRTFDTQHACYGATAALQLAGQWAAVGNGQGRKAIVVATDIAKYELASAGEPTQGAGAVAMLVSTKAPVIRFDSYPDSVYTEDVMDFWRPHYSTTAMVDGKFSLSCYLRALERTYEAHEQNSGLSFDDFRYLLFHIPFPKMATKGFTRLYEREAEAGRRDLANLDADFDRLTRPSLWANMEVGNIYSGSLYLAIAGLLEQQDAAVAGSRLGLFSYGSGCCAEFFSGLVGPDAAAWRGRIGVQECLAGRVEIDFATYLAFRAASEARARDGSYLAPEARACGGIRFPGVTEHRRVYEGAAASAVA